jgi:hypothetical protein
MLTLYYSTSQLSEEPYEVAVAFPAEETFTAILAESHEGLLGLSGSEDAVLSTMAVQMLDDLVITEH